MHIQKKGAVGKAPNLFCSALLLPTEYQFQEIHGSAGENLGEDKKNDQRVTKCPIGND